MQSITLYFEIRICNKILLSNNNIMDLQSIKSRTVNWNRDASNPLVTNRKWNTKLDDAICRYLQGMYMESIIVDRIL